MKIKLLPILALNVTLSLSTLAAGISAATDGVYIVVSAIPTNGVVWSNSALGFRPFCDIGEADIEFALDPAYSTRINLTDSNGNEVSKTESGSRFGTKFDDYKRYSQGRPYPFDISSESFTNNLGMGGARPFSDYPVGPLVSLTPADLFNIKKPGTYTLKIQMQAFLIHRDSNTWNPQFIRFSPIKLKVVKTADK